MKSTSYDRAYFCSFCGIHGHMTTSCRVIPPPSAIESNYSPNPAKNNEILNTYQDTVTSIYSPEQKLILEVTDKEENLRGLLIAYGKDYSQKQDDGKENKRRLKALADEEGLQLVIYNPKTGESTLYVDEKKPKSKKK